MPNVGAFTPEQIYELLEQLNKHPGARLQYVGSRYVPKFADPYEWDSTQVYEPLTIVTYQGNSYTSRQYVPAGKQITDTEFWVETGNYNAQIEQYRQEVLALQSMYNNGKTYITPEQYDSISDAVSDAISNGYVLSFKPGKRYELQSTIEVTGKLEIAGNWATLVTTGSFPAITIGLAGVGQVYVHDINLVGTNNAANTNNHGIYGSPYYSIFENVNFSQFYDCVHLTAGNASGTLVENRFNNCNFRNYYNFGIYCGETGNNKLTDGFISGCIFDANEGAQSAIFIGSSAGWNISNCHMYGFNATAVNVVNCDKTKIDGLYIEYYSNYAIQIASQGSCTVSNCFVISSTENTAVIRHQQTSYVSADYALLVAANVLISLRDATPGSIFYIESGYVHASNVRTLGNGTIEQVSGNGNLAFINSAAVDLINTIGNVSNENALKGKISLYNMHSVNSDQSEVQIPVPEFSYSAGYALAVVRFVIASGTYFTSNAAVSTVDVLLAVNQPGSNVIATVVNNDTTNIPTFTATFENGVLTVNVALAASKYGRMFNYLLV